MKCSCSKEKYGRFMCGYSLTGPNARRNARNSGVSGSSRMNSFISEPSTQTLVWTDLTIRTLRHLPDRSRSEHALLTGREMGETHPDAALPAIDPVMDERGAVEAGPRDNVVGLSEDVSCFVVAQLPEVEGDQREIRGRGIEVDTRIPGDLPDEEGGEIPALPGDFILAFPFDEPDPGKERGDPGIVRRTGLELLRHLLRMGQQAGVRAGPALPDRRDRIRVVDIKSTGAGDPEECLVPGEDEGTRGDGRQADRDLPGSLCPVDDEENVVCRTVFRNRPHILQGTEHVAPVRHHHEPGLGPDGCLDLVDRDIALAEGYGGETQPPFPGKGMEGAEHRVMFQLRRNRMERRCLFFHETVDEEVQGIRGTPGEDEMVRLFSIEEPCKCFPGCGRIIGGSPRGRPARFEEGGVQAPVRKI